MFIHNTILNTLHHINIYPTIFTHRPHHNRETKGTKLKLGKAFTGGKTDRGARLLREEQRAPNRYPLSACGLNLTLVLLVY